MMRTLTGCDSLWQAKKLRQCTTDQADLADHEEMKRVIRRLRGFSQIIQESSNQEALGVILLFPFP